MPSPRSSALNDILYQLILMRLVTPNLSLHLPLELDSPAVPGVIEDALEDPVGIIAEGDMDRIAILSPWPEFHAAVEYRLDAFIWNLA